MYVDPRSGSDLEAGTRYVRCVCGASMSAERGTQFEDDGEQQEWMWWRCDDRNDHVTRALPLPVRMARSV